ncbi:tricarballylate utilization 4Fe-4S protein TcuB [Acinetobacter shaoyimingii]|uniref:Tricarballylate utilization 4Fe-4S protein TcuB n=1 Tax=Acinetobacter shaoyimingii TaxID=2715164 RepID=A0A6G8RT28_9GAMM|nr:tricarballylate utilization 4Fe-4S protein TcuB [Acinetobacter shaoyimingii]NHB56473.1 tricarballylate utilization 4Fe-4S protein TcuB [Acinetobacter shaoyimingii]QIO05027.1 tricarballylate utilization 4Fe-4S protein TcuB [Acinetobacter shaoyimingii]
MNASTKNLIPVVQLTANEEQVKQALQICNACRYCETFCAVFPAMTKRLEFNQADIHYMANLCHNCGACLHACQYAPPHEFGVNIPQAMAQVRLETYQKFAVPESFGKLYQKAGITLVSALVITFIFFMLAGTIIQGNDLFGLYEGNFYAIFPHNFLALLFGSVFGIAFILLGLGIRKFWNQTSEVVLGGVEQPDILQAAKNVLTLKYLDGGHGKGCNEEDDRYTLIRRRFHHFTMYGFLLCFLATIVATGYHYFLNLHAPYPIFSLPVILGTLGGIGLVIGPVGLLYLNIKRDPQHGDAKQKPMDRGFIFLLLLISITGLALLAFRDSTLMALLLIAHLATVMTFFLTIPFGKFAHGFYRSAALLKFAVEERRSKKAK